MQLRGVAEIIDDPEAKFEILARQLSHFEPADSSRTTPSADVASDRRVLPGIRGVRMRIESVQAKMKYGDNKTPHQRREIAAHLQGRGGPADEAARRHLLRRTGPAG